MNNAKNNIIISHITLVFAIFLILTFSIFFISQDNYRSGDEVVTYSMANNRIGGFVFSNGRVGKYFNEHIISNSFPETISNLFNMITDVIAKKGDSDFFKSERPSETGWYTGTDFFNMFTPADNERFDYINVYKNACSDESNPFLYYMMVHTSSSLFPIGSGESKWCAGIVNIIFLFILFFILYKIVILSGLNHYAALFISLSAIFSYEIASRISYLRAYIFSAAVASLIFYLHIKLKDSLKSDEEGTASFKKYCLLIALTYSVGYFGHYMTSVYSFVLFSIFLIRYHKLFLAGNKLKHYICTALISVFISFCIYPVSVFGMLKKFSGFSSGREESGTGLLSILSDFFRIINNSIFSPMLFPIILLIIIAGIVFVVFSKRSLNISLNVNSIWIDALLSSFFTMLINMLFMGGYLVVATPLFILGIFGICYDILSQIFHGTKISEKVPIVALALFSFIFIKCGIEHTSALINTDNNFIEPYISSFEDRKGTTAIFMRYSKSAFAYAPLFESTGNVLTITDAPEQLGRFANDKRLSADNNSSLLLFLPNNEEYINLSDDVLMNTLHYSGSKTLVSEGEYILKEYYSS